MEGQHPGMLHGKAASLITQTNGALVTRATQGTVPSTRGANPCPPMTVWFLAGVGHLMSPKEAWEPPSSLLPLRKMLGLQGWALCPPPGDPLTLEPSGGPGGDGARPWAGH